MSESLSSQFERTAPGDVGIIGDPVEHSLSPMMHNAAFKTWWGAFRDRKEHTPEYHRFHVKREELVESIALVKKYRLKGVNVTVPHKMEVCKLVDTLDPYAEKTGAVNTIVSMDGRLIGYNTDADGFKRTIIRDMNLDTEGKKALVLGLGGTGRVISLVLLDLHFREVFLWNRNEEKSEAFARGVNDGRMKSVTSSTLRETMENVDLVINATSVGLKEEDGLPTEACQFRPGQFVFDVIYHRETAFLTLAKKSGAVTLNGMGMLVYQGARSFEIWTGAPAPVEIMQNVLKQSMKGV